MPRAKYTHPQLPPHVIKAARAALGWTQTDLAACMGRDPSVVALYETKRTKPNIHTYWKLRGAFENNGITFLIEKNVIVGIRWSKP